MPVLKVYDSGTGTWIDVGGGGSGGSWGTITGDINTQTDLTAALSGRMAQVATPKITTSLTTPSTPVSGDLWLDPGAQATYLGSSGTLIAEYTVPSTTTSVTFSGLDSNLHGGYTILVDGIGTVNGSTDGGIKIGFNGDLTNSNYSSTLSRNYATTLISTNYAIPYCFNLNSILGGQYQINVNVISNTCVFDSKGSFYDVSGLGNLSWTGYCSVAKSNITSITFTAVTTNNIAANTIFKIYKRK